MTEDQAMKIAEEMEPHISAIHELMAVRNLDLPRGLFCLLMASTVWLENSVKDTVQRKGENVAAREFGACVANEIIKAGPEAVMVCLSMLAEFVPKKIRDHQALIEAEKLLCSKEGQS